MSNLGYLPTLTPAYGRDYATAQEVEAALNQSKDFCVGVGPPYIALAELAEFRTMFNVRFKKLAEVAVFEIVDGRAVLRGSTDEDH